MRPHPASDFSATKYAQWQKLIDGGDLTKLLKRVNVIFCSNASSIAVDGYLAGKHALIMLDGNRFNFCPLRGLPNNMPIVSAQNLESAIVYSNLNLKTQPVNYFYLDDNLLSWRKLLSE